MGYPSPGVLTSAVDARASPCRRSGSIIPAQVFDFVLPTNSTITHPRQLKGKKIALWSIGWNTIVDPILAEAGVDPKTVKYVNSGRSGCRPSLAARPTRGSRGKASGPRSRQPGFGLSGELKFLIGTEFSKEPSNVYSGAEGRSRRPSEGRRSTPASSQGHDHGTRVREGEPARRGADHLRPRGPGACRSAIKPQVGPTSRWCSSARATAPRIASGQVAGAITTPRAGRGYLSAVAQARPDEEDAHAWPTSHERPRSAGQREGRQGEALPTPRRSS